VKKELRPFHDNVTCDVCGRTMLKGERTQTYLVPGGQRRQVCELCFARAESSGWLRESVAGDAPARVPRQEPRRSLLGRLRRPRPAEEEPEAVPEEAPAAYEEPVDPYAEPGEPLELEEEPPPEPEPEPERPRSVPKDPRHVRAVPTTAEVKVERAFELFNGSEHSHTVGGLARTLGAPLVSARPELDQPSAVTIVIAWELSWYVYRVDLGDEADPVVMLEKGEELDQLDESLQDWNAAMDANGGLVTEAVAAGGGGSE